MIYKVLFHKKAEIEVVENAKWYEERSIKASMNFIKELDKAILILEKNPFLFSKVYKNKRKINLRNFPFSIIFIIVKEKVYILSVFHQSRNPKIWKK